MLRFLLLFTTFTLLLAACAAPAEPATSDSTGADPASPSATNPPAATPSDDCETPFPVNRLRSTWQLTDFCTFQPGVFEEILSGGVPRDGIPPIDNPQFESVASATAWLANPQPVIAFVHNGIARAYPLAILTRHEIVNDIIDGDPVAVTFCPLCNSAIVFDRQVNDTTYRFGVSGLLRNSDLIMWDDVTESWWQQFTGQGIVGTHTGDQLTILPSLVISFELFAETYPDGEVLSAGGQEYNRNPYVGYDSSPNPFLFRGELDPRLFATERVLAGFVRGVPIAYSFEVLNEEFVINDDVGGVPVVAFWQPGATSALDQSNIAQSRDVGMAALYERTVNGQVLTFALASNGIGLTDLETGSQWSFFGLAESGPLAGTQLEQVLAFPHFWFAWAAFQPDTLLYSAP